MKDRDQRSIEMRDRERGPTASTARSHWDKGRNVMSWDRRRDPKGMSQMEQVMQRQRDMEIDPIETGVEYHVTGKGM